MSRIERIKAYVAAEDKSSTSETVRFKNEQVLEDQLRQLNESQDVKSLLLLVLPGIERLKQLVATGKSFDPGTAAETGRSLDRLLNLLKVICSYRRIKFSDALTFLNPVQDLRAALAAIAGEIPSVTGAKAKSPDQVDCDARRKQRRRCGRRLPLIHVREMQATEDRESLFGIYCSCKRQTVKEGKSFDDSNNFAQFVDDEIAYNLTDTETRRLLKLADGMSYQEIGEQEGCRREAVICSINSMIENNEYCRLAAEHGILKARKNQYK